MIRAMIPVRHSAIFKSRWWALLWAAGFIWFALEVAAPGEGDGKAAGNGTDVTLAPITAADEKALQEAFRGL
jgi:hypothetical protein